MSKPCIKEKILGACNSNASVQVDLGHFPVSARNGTMKFQKHDLTMDVSLFSLGRQGKNQKTLLGRCIRRACLGPMQDNEIHNKVQGSHGVRTLGNGGVKLKNMGHTWG